MAVNEWRPVTLGCCAVALVSNTYTPVFTAACVDIGAVNLYFVSFTASDIGAGGTITSASVFSPTGSVTLAGGTVNVLGSTDAAPCGSGTPVDFVFGFIDGGAH